MNLPDDPIILKSKIRALHSDTIQAITNAVALINTDPEPSADVCAARARLMSYCDELKKRLNEGEEVERPEFYKTMGNDTYVVYSGEGIGWMLNDCYAPSMSPSDCWNEDVRSDPRQYPCVVTVDKWYRTYCIRDAETYQKNIAEVAKAQAARSLKLLEAIKAV